ncbi:uncharacterized protein LOC131205479 [Anopheles bellator]|uniref:uncharacterized protein LOC131205479 n=1 Tax=Anopheles bellator TaxID=139047 RepID=UPI00264918D2|nr:uncharacterized protein LOC131205479 [Anopheles bellator]
MKKIRRWLLLFAVIIALMVRVDGLKATSLIFGRGPTTTTTTTTSTTTTAATSTTEESAEAAAEDESADQGEDGVTKAPLTGIPQVDYVWDPNLPRELRGFNLSNYPFLDSVPAEEDIGFTCDPKLHDGFYASIKYNCQLYHHCIHGMRYDFLCANYTAFDQKTFICHFASEVDCKNSPKYWFRNEPLYKATTTTTVKPPPTTSTTAAPTTVPSRPKPLRKPVRRRRPQVDYYYYDEEYEDDYYEERQRRRKNRPRNRRPIYDDEYEEEDRFERPVRPAVDRYRERDRDRLEDEDDYDDRRTPAVDRRPVKTRMRNGERRPVPVDDERRYYGEERRRRPSAADDRRRPIVEEEEKPLRPERRRVPAVGHGREVDRKPAKRPLYEEDEEDDYDPPAYGEGRRRGSSEKGRQQQQQQNDVVTVKPAGGSIYGRPRAAPRVNRPVPLAEKSKYAYGAGEGAGPTKGFTKTSTTPPPPPAPVVQSDPEYYDEYEEVEQPRRETSVDKRKAGSSEYGEGGQTAVGRKPRPSASSDVVYYDDVIIAKEDLPLRSVPGNVRKPEQSERINSRDNSELATGSNRGYGTGEKTRASQSLPKQQTSARDEQVDERDGDEYDAVPAVGRLAARPAPATNLYANFKNKKQPPPAPPQPVESSRPPVHRSTKRPFLPSRGGNPYLARGLQPVGVGAKQPTPAKPAGEPEKPAPFRIDVEGSSTTVAPPKPRAGQPEEAPSSPQPPPEVVNVKTLDQLYDDEFDVTLNDALNPTLKPLTRSAPQNFFRNRYVHQPDQSEFVPFEPSYAPSEFRRTAVRPPSVQLYHNTPSVALVGTPARQRYDPYAAYQY